MSNNISTNGVERVRLDYIDYAKAFGMLVIMWGHCRLHDWSHSFVYAFHIPLFFFLSGMVFDRSRYKDFGTFLKKKVKSLLIPYVIFSVATWIIWVSFSYFTHTNVESYWHPLLETIIAQGSGGFLVHNVPLWFVTCLFVMEVVFFFLSKLKRIWINVISIALMLLCICLLKFEVGFDIRLAPWNIEVAMLCIPFFAAGHWCVSAISHNEMIKWVGTHRIVTVVLFVLSFCFVLIGSYYNGDISFGHVAIGKYVPLTYVTALFGISMHLLLCLFVANTSFNSNNGWIAEKIKWFGSKSFNAMATHNPIKGFFSVLVGALFGISSVDVSENSYYSFIAFLLTLFATVIIMITIERLTGKKR